MLVMAGCGVDVVLCMGMVCCFRLVWLYLVQFGYWLLCLFDMILAIFVCL